MSSIIIKKSVNTLKGPGGRGPRQPIAGVFPSSSQFGEQIVKFRVPSLDAFIGGGVPIGSICLIVDDFPSKFGDMVLKSFVADGASYNHRIFVASRRTTPEEYVKNLPVIKKNSKAEEVQSSGMDMTAADLKIAWRYGHPTQSGQALKGGKDELHQAFDFSKKTTAAELGAKHIYLSKCVSEAQLTSSCIFLEESIIQEILDCVQGLDYETSKTVSNVARICISYCEELLFSKNFMLKLRAIVRHTNSCAVITVSDAAFCASKKTDKNAPLMDAEHLADIVISLQAILDSKRSEELGGVDGICSVKKVCSSNSLKIFEPPKDVGITFKKKRLLFHELNLPPEGESTTQRESSSESGALLALNPTGGGCGGGSGGFPKNIEAQF